MGSMNRIFKELKPYYTEEDLIEARKNNQLYFFDVTYLFGVGIEHDGYSKYYGNLDDLLEDVYKFLKKYRIEMIAGSKLIHIRSVDEIVPSYGLVGNGNGNIIGYMSIFSENQKNDKLKISLDKKLNFNLEEFMKVHDDVVLPEDEINQKQKRLN